MWVVQDDPPPDLPHECELCGESSLDGPLEQVEERGQYGPVWEWRCQLGWGCQDPAVHDEASYQGEVLT